MRWQRGMPWESGLFPSLPSSAFTELTWIIHHGGDIDSLGNDSAIKLGFCPRHYALSSVFLPY